VTICDICKGDIPDDEQKTIHISNEDAFAITVSSS